MTRRPPDDRSGNRAPPQVADPDQFARQRQLREIYELRENVMQIRQEIEVSRAHGGISRRQATLSYSGAVKNLLAAIEPLALHRYREVGEDYWFDEKIASYVLDPPSPEEVSVNTEDSDFEDLESREYSLVGLQEVLDSEAVLTIDFDVTYQDQYGTEEAKTVTVDRVLPLDAYESAYRYANLFLAEIGPTDLQPDERHQQNRI